MKSVNKNYKIAKRRLCGKTQSRRSDRIAQGATEKSDPPSRVIRYIRTLFSQGGALPYALLLPASFYPVETSQSMQGKGGLQTTFGLISGSISYVSAPPTALSRTKQAVNNFFIGRGQSRRQTCHQSSRQRRQTRRRHQW